MTHHHHHNYQAGPYWGVPHAGGPWVGGFGSVPPTMIYGGQAIGNYQPGFVYPVGHPYHHANHMYNGVPLGPYVHGTAYPMGHPYHHHHAYHY